MTGVRGSWIRSFGAWRKTPSNEKPGSGVPVNKGMRGEGRAKQEHSDRFKNKTEGSGRGGWSDGPGGSG